MIRIAVVEDEADMAAQLVEYLRRYETESKEVLDITVYADGDEIVEKYCSQFELILMDIEMPFMDGMTAAEEIRKVDSETVIIFITNMANYAIRGYGVDALDYVLKPVSYFALSQRLDRAITRMKRRAEKYIVVSVKGGVQKLEVSSIYFVESQGHNMIFHTAFGEYVTPGTMKELEEQLKTLHFCRGNKGYLINLAHVSGVRDGCAIVHEKCLLLSRARKNEFLAALANYVGEVIK